jgi:hypothetical protein
MESYPFMKFYIMNVCWIRDSFIEVDKIVNKYQEGNNKFIDRIIEKIIDHLYFLGDILEKCSKNLEGVIIDTILQYLVFPGFLRIFTAENLGKGPNKKEILGVKTAIYGLYLTLSLIKVPK